MVGECIDLAVLEHEEETSIMPAKRRFNCFRENDFMTGSITSSAGKTAKDRIRSLMPDPAPASG